ncbi:MAG: biotin--[acetyl-CoA-carboxylase] ligase, partial [Thermoplasmata archaeon]|nr:biotin--[acetyl-CoA-carboxylase] ligase [Thermoplasmata archaeon]
MPTFRRFDTVPSTQELAVALAHSGAEPGTTLVARRQESGKGRAGHSWSSPEGGLYLSTIVSAPRDGSTLFPLSVCARIGESLGERYSVTTAVKWPNDLLEPRR